MRLIIFLGISISLLVVPVSLSYCAEGRTERMVVSGQDNATWVNTVSQDVTVVTMELKEINKETPQETVNKLLQNALEKVKQMRKEVEKEGIVVEGFSLNVTFPPSITIDFKFKD